MYLKNLNGLAFVVGVTAIAVFGVMHVQATSNNAPVQWIPFQGCLTDAAGQPVPDGSYDLTFTLYTSAEGQESVWGETQKDVNVRDGGFEVELGTVRLFSDPDSDSNTDNAVDFSERLYLGIKVGDNPEMRPRRRITPAVFAAEAGYAREAGRGSYAENATYANTAGHAGTAGHADTAGQATHHSNVIPVGCIMVFWGNVAPDGWLLCDGRDIADTAAYGTLRNMVGAKTPDLRGMFLRGADDPDGDGGMTAAGVDPDASTRVDRLTGTQKAGVGSFQDCATALPNTHFWADLEHTHGYLEGYDGPRQGGGTEDVYNDAKGETTGSGLSKQQDTSQGGGDKETRPKNVAVNYIIKY